MSLIRVTPAALVALLVVAATGASVTREAASRATGVRTAARPRSVCAGDIPVTQSMTGRISGCLRLGNVAPGRHTIALQELISGPPPRAGRRRLPPAPRPVEPAVTLRLSPSAGGPGTVVTVIGRLRRPLRLRGSHLNGCWDGCQDGLPYGDITLHWTSARSFRTRIVVPAAPWIQAGSAQVVPLSTGSYPVGIDCLALVPGCDAVTEGSATFHLHVRRAPAWCPTTRRCARLHVTPARAAPGEVVRIRGVAPLLAGNASAAGAYDAVVLRGPPHGPAIRLRRDTVNVGQAAIDVTAPPRYAARAPLAQVSDGVAQIAADPAAPGTVAWCAGQTIAVAGATGTVQVPSASAKAVLTAMGFGLRYEAHPACAAVAPLATSAGAPAGLAVAFSVTVAAGAPPFYLAALVTRDSGRTWTPIPVPRGSAAAGFGGFRYVGSTLQAVFAHSVKAAPRAYPAFDPTRPLAEVADADGQTWSSAPLGCPAAGPCVTFAPYLPGNCAMNGTQQALLRSADGGRSWSALTFPYPVQACGEAELVATSATSELLVDSTSTYPVLGTADGGAAWHDVALARRGGQGDLSVLPDGSLIMADGLGYGGPWKLLRGGRTAWCELRGPSRALRRRLQLAPPTVINGQLWWLTGSVDSATALPTLQRLALSALAC